MRTEVWMTGGGVLADFANREISSLTLASSRFVVHSASNERNTMADMRAIVIPIHCAKT